MSDFEKILGTISTLILFAIPWIVGIIEIFKTIIE